MGLRSSPFLPRVRRNRRRVLQWENCQNLQTNRYAKTSFLQLREDAFEILGRTKVVFAPTGRIPSFEGSTVAFSLARSLAPYLPPPPSYTHKHTLTTLP